MDRPLAHKYLDIGIDLHATFNIQPANAEDGTIGMFSMDRDAIDAVFHTHTGAGLSRDEHLALFDFVMDFTGEEGHVPDAFMLADLFYSRYMELVKDSAGMADSDTLRTIPH